MLLWYVVEMWLISGYRGMVQVPLGPTLRSAQDSRQQSMVTRMDIFMWSNTQQLPADLNGTHMETFRQVHFGDQLIMTRICDF